MSCVIFSAVTLRQQGEIGGLSLHGGCCRAISPGICSVTNGAVTVVHLFTRIRRRVRNRHMLQGSFVLRYRLLRYRERGNHDQNCSYTDEFHNTHSLPPELLKPELP